MRDCDRALRLSMRLKVRTLTPSMGVSARTRPGISELAIGRTWGQSCRKVQSDDSCGLLVWTERQTGRQASKQVNRRTGRQADSEKDDDGVKDDE